MTSAKKSKAPFTIAETGETEAESRDSGLIEAVIYCRVSSAKQVEEGHGLASQETRCREYAARKGYAVAQVFHDKAVSGGLSDRPGVMAMLTYLQGVKGIGGAVVIIDDISRLARDMRVHSDLRLAITLAGGRLESPSVKFGDTSDDKLIENLLASVSQHQREKNGEQTKNRMRARAMNGYWVFHAPVGFKYEKVAGHGKLLVRDEPVASIIQEGLEAFASGRIETQGELKRFFESRPEFPKDTPRGEIRYETIIRILNRPHYAGYIEVPEWGVSLRKGHHQGLISLETYEQVHERIRDGARAPARADISTDFPLARRRRLRRLRAAFDLLLVEEQNRQEASLLHVLQPGLRELSQIDSAGPDRRRVRDAAGCPPAGRFAVCDDHRHVPQRLGPAPAPG